MAVLISSKVAGQTREGYDLVKNAVEESIKKAPGFIIHCAKPGEDAWELLEVWRSKKEADQWFAATVAPNLPPGIHPKRSYQDLYSLILPFE
jgi:hypothetical protein